MGDQQTHIGLRGCEGIALILSVGVVGDAMDDFAVAHLKWDEGNMQKLRGFLPVGIDMGFGISYHVAEV